MFKIFPETPSDVPEIEVFLNQSFGPERSIRTAYKIRQGLSPIEPLKLVAKSEDGQLLASIRYWPIKIGEAHNALLLGPIVVRSDKQGAGIGVALIEHSLQKAKQLGYDKVVLIGDPEYYERFGFVNAIDLGIEAPGPVERHRLLIAALQNQPLDNVSGLISGDHTA